MIVRPRSRPPRAVNYRLMRGMGDATSDYLAYEAALSSAWQNLTPGGAPTAPLPASMAPVQPGQLNPNRLTSCDRTNCPGPYSDPGANYDMWVQQNQAWGIPVATTAGPITAPVSLVTPKGMTLQPNLVPYGYVSPIQYQPKPPAVLVDSNPGVTLSSTRIPTPAQQSTGTPPKATIDSSGNVVLTPPASGFSLSSIPWWGWVTGGAAVLFAMKGGR